jgi:hypothetical protein
MYGLTQGSTYAKLEHPSATAPAYLEHRAGFGVAGLKGRAMTSTQKDARRLALVLIGERKGSDRRGCG